MQEFFAPLPQAIARAAREHRVQLRTAAGELASPKDAKLRVCMDPELSQLLQDEDLQVGEAQRGCGRRERGW